jgi:hypothetical protein
MTLAQPLYSVTAEVRMEIINLLLQGASILPAATIQPFLFLLQLAGAKRVVNDRNNHCFLHGDIAVSVPSSHNVIRYHRASPLHQHLILYSNNATQKHFNTSACRRNDGFDSAALPVVPCSTCSKAAPSIPHLKRRRTSTQFQLIILFDHNFTRNVLFIQQTVDFTWPS